MRTKLFFEIECGETTCASVPGKFCRFLKMSGNGRNACHLFGAVYEGGDGWIKRHPDCRSHQSPNQKVKK